MPECAAAAVHGCLAPPREQALHVHSVGFVSPLYSFEAPDYDLELARKALLSAFTAPSSAFTAPKFSLKTGNPILERRPRAPRAAAVSMQFEDAHIWSTKR